jgi:hypothetical protein
MKRVSGAREGVRMALAALVLVLALAGCGGSSSASSKASATSAANTSAPSTAVATRTAPAAHSSTTAAPSTKRRALTRAQLLADAGAICKRVGSEIAAVKAKSASAAEIARVVPKHAEVEEAGAIELSGLVAPRALAREWESIVASRVALANELTELVLAAQHGDTAKIKALSASKAREHARLLKAAKAADLSVCGQI